MRVRAWTAGAIACGLVACGGGGGGSGNAAPVASFTFTPATGDAPLRVEVDAGASSDADGSIVAYLWSFGDGATASGVTASHVYPDVGAFTIELVVTDDDGARGTSRHAVAVTPPPVDYVGLYGSSVIEVTDVLLVLDVEGGVVSGSLRDGAGRAGTVTGTDTGVEATLRVTWTTGCAGGLDVQALHTAEGLELTFDGNDCEGVHLGGLGEVLRHAGEVLAFGRPSPVDLTLAGSELFWSSAADPPLERYEPATGTLTGLAPRIGALLGLTHHAGVVLWTEELDSGAGACGSATATLALRRTLDGTALETLDRVTSCGRDLASDVVVSAGAAFWAYQSGGSPDAFAIRRTPLDGSPPDTPVQVSHRIRALAADGQHLYWCEESVGPVEDSRVRRVPLVGGMIEDLFRTPHRPLSLAVDPDTLLVAERFWASEDGNLVRVPKSGGAGTVLASFTSPPRRVVLAGTTVGWITDAAVGSLALPGGGAVPLAQTIAPAVDVALDGDRLVWLEREPLCCGGRLRSVPLAGGAAQELAPATAPLRLARAPDGAFLWTEGGEDPAADAELVRRSPLGALETWVAGFQRSPAIAVDASDVYCVQGWWIKRVPRAGGVPRRFAHGAFGIADVALDDEHVYWLEGDPLGTLRRRPKAGGAIETLASGNGPCGALVIAGGRALWVESPDTIRSTLVTGGPATAFVQGLEFPTHMVSDGEHVYFNAQDAGLVRRKHLSGGALETVGGYRPFSLSTLFVDARHVLAIDQVFLMRYAKEGGGDEFLVPVRNDAFEAGSVASADGFVYWSETLLGTVGRDIRSRTP